MSTPHHQQPQQARPLRAQLDALKRDDEMLYHVLAVDVWALAKTMDEFQPGFWAAFMKNRDKALKRFLEEVVKRRTAAARTSDHPFYRSIYPLEDPAKGEAVESAHSPDGDRSGESCVF